MQISLTTFIWIVRQFLSNSESEFHVDFDELRQIIFRAQSDGHITVAEGFEVLEAIYSMLSPALPTEWSEGPSKVGQLSQLSTFPSLREKQRGDHD